MLELYVRDCSAMLLDLCPKVLSPRNTKILNGFWRAMFFPIWGSNARMEATFWAPIWAKLAILGPLKAPGSYSYASWAKLGGLEGKMGHREVMLKLSWAMSCYVEAIGQIFFGHVAGFASRNALPPAGPRY